MNNKQELSEDFGNADHYLSIPNGETFLCFARIFETFIGVLFAILVNSDVDRIRDFSRNTKKPM